MSKGLQGEEVISRARPSAIFLALALLLQIQPVAANASELVVTQDYQGTYSRSAFKHWIDEDRNGCNTRTEVLIAEALVKPKVGKKCVLTGGRWLSAYDGKTTAKASDLDVDHLVPLAEAWRSGAWKWTPAQREAFANDLSDPRALIAVSLSQNRSKGDKDIASWLPAKGVCTYISNWMAIKFRYALSVDANEATVLNRYLQSCSITNIDVVFLEEFQPNTEVMPTPIPTPTPAPAVKKMPEIPKPLLKSIESTYFEIEVPEIANWDFSIMKLTLNLTGYGAGNCKSETVIESLPFTLKCSGILAKQVWIVSLQGSGTYGRVEPTLAFSGSISLDSFPKAGALPTPSPVTPTPTPEPIATDSATSPAIKRCWVNGYTRKNGTYVSGYYRSC